MTEIEWAEAWVSGGEVPISLASRYLSAERTGIQTPDENLVHESPVNLSPFAGMFPDGVRGISMEGCSIGGEAIPDFSGANFYGEDGLILSFCNVQSEYIARRLGKKACVRIDLMRRLKRNLDEQIGIRGIARQCGYVEDHQRNHFTKSAEDSWQDEYRIFWDCQEETTVNIPVGTAELVATYE